MGHQGDLPEPAVRHLLLRRSRGALADDEVSGQSFGFGLLVASLMWMIRRWHLSNLARYPDELNRLLEIARHDKSH